MTGKIFRSCFLVGLAMMVLCTALFLVVMTNKHEQTVYAEMQQEMCYVRHGLEQSGKDYLTTLTGTQERLTWVAKDGTVLYDSVADPATMEIKYAPDTTKMYNADICQELGITPPDGYTAIEA